MAVMHAVQDNTHALPGSDQGRDSDQESDDGKNSPSSTSVTESNENGSDETAYNAGDTKTAGKDDAGAVAVADSPADEVWMGLAAQRPLDRGGNVAEGRRMGGVLKRVQQLVALFGGEVELASASISDIDGDDSGDLFAVRLDGDWATMSIQIVEG